MWEVSMWQYFTATIVNFNARTLKFEIIWDDQDPSGRIIDYYNLALDRVPDDDEVAVGSIVLFPQGEYRGEEGVRLGGQRWHQGKITFVSKGENGEKLYSGQHTKGKEDGKWVTFRGYEPEFYSLTRNQLRIAPNVLDLLSAEASNDEESVHDTNEDAADSCDVFISYSKLNSLDAVRNNEVGNQDLPPSYNEALAAMCDPHDIRNQLQQNGLLVGQEPSGDLMKTVKMIHNAKVVIAFLSDEYANDEICRQEFQYAKKTAKKSVIPVVIGESFEWMMSVVGLLIAGELYIHFKDKTVQEMKMQELLKAVGKSVPTGADTTDAAVTSVPKKLPTPDVFVSYCWSNSNKALQSHQIPKLVGSQFADARRIKEDLSKSGDLVLWLDIERLQTTNQSAESMSMFQQIASGLNTAKVVIVCVSAEYAKSDNCRSEFQFALKSLKKPIIPVVVGEGSDWRDTVIGLLVSSQETEIIDMQSVTTEENYRNALEKIEKNVKAILGTKNKTKEKKDFRAPMPGDHVICHHHKWAFYYATIESFNAETLEYTVNWDDNDPSGRHETYKNVAIDTIPSPDQIGVDSIVFFPQGSYGATLGNNTGGGRFHQGRITNIHKDAFGVTLYDGHHTKGDDDGKWVTYKDYNYYFTNLKIDQLRIAPNAMDALMACKQAFSLDD
ncbi:uncharacterized protein LOC116301857 [Actinia tenebrosa]|uniref:Uncharacterized protein LOC116301857 n=1 Tax=Actinia tenebrosa TaxID=6105 RepID=A0A6P8IJA6_ACTTE|nr:uncharacterized protein LOC116301857 [Actinia tenebrosa]